MSSGKRYHPEYAGIVAEGILYHLSRYCERMEIAGSLRRKTADVGDIEIVCIPKEEYPQVSMLGIASEQGPKVFPLYDEIRRLSWLEPRKDANGQTKMGNRYMALWDNCTGVPIDLFCVLPPAQWGVIMTLRTGPADFSHELMRVARRRGYKCEDGQLLDVRRKQGAPVKSPEERDFFKLINAAWIEPENRK